LKEWGFSVGVGTVEGIHYKLREPFRLQRLVVAGLDGGIGIDAGKSGFLKVLSGGGFDV